MKITHITSIDEITGYHPPCGFATLTVDKKGKEKKT